MESKTVEQLEQERVADHNKRNHEVMARHAKYRPTPTIEEVQLALEGKHVDDKELDGSDEQHVHRSSAPVEKSKPADVKKAAEAESHDDGSAYKTRASTAKK